MTRAATKKGLPRDRNVEPEIGVKEVVLLTLHVVQNFPAHRLDGLPERSAFDGQIVRGLLQRHPLTLVVMLQLLDANRAPGNFSGGDGTGQPVHVRDDEPESGVVGENARAEVRERQP